MSRTDANPRTLATWIINEGMHDEMQILVAAIHHFTPKSVVASIDDALEIVKIYNDQQAEILKERISIKRGRRELVTGFVKHLKAIRQQQLAHEIRRKRNAA